MQDETWWHAAKHFRSYEIRILTFCYYVIKNNEFRLFFAWIRGPAGPCFDDMARPNIKRIPNHCQIRYGASTYSDKQSRMLKLTKWHGLDTKI